MIEKLPEIQIHSCAKINEKLNEVIDAVNKLQDIIRQIGEWGSSKGECLWCENITEFANKDLYTKQRKWIGKACWFWDEKEEKKVFGILTTIDSCCELSDMCPYWNDTTKNWFEHCEPVKDDIIYKKEQQ